MIVEPNKINPELKQQLVNELAVLFGVKAEKLLLKGFVIQLEEGSYNLSQIEKNAILQAYVHAEGSISKTASLLGVTRKTVYNLLKKHQIDTLINIYE